MEPGFRSKKKKEPARLGDLLQNFFKQKQPTSISIESLVFAAWPKAVGADVNRNAAPTSFRNGILFVQTRHPIWTSELQAKRHIILRKLNEALSKEIVKDIHFRLAKY